MGGMDGNITLRRVVGLTVLLVSGSATPHAQAPAPIPAFDVASIKENVSTSDNASVRAQPGGRVTVSNNTLRNIVRNAYNVQNYQIVGGPDWINTVRWDITAKAPEDAPPPQLLLMLRTLLADRFKLVIRHETRDMPIYALALARKTAGWDRNFARPILIAPRRSRPRKRKAKPRRPPPTAGRHAAPGPRAEA
jgi:uncharacterized protein (TIGR03435 family)